MTALKLELDNIEVELLLIAINEHVKWLRGNKAQTFNLDRAKEARILDALFHKIKSRYEEGDSE